LLNERRLYIFLALMTQHYVKPSGTLEMLLHLTSGKVVADGERTVTCYAHFTSGEVTAGGRRTAGAPALTGPRGEQNQKVLRVI
jgi:hypothetical protein